MFLTCLQTVHKTQNLYNSMLLFHDAEKLEWIEAFAK